MKKMKLTLVMLLLLPVISMAQHFGGIGRGDYSAYYTDPVVVTATLGTTGPTVYLTLKTAFDAINLGTHQGIITVKINASTTEAASAVLHESGYSPGPGKSAVGSNYASVTVYPTATGLSVSGNVNAPLIDLNGADNVTIDGRVNQSGARDLTIINSSVYTGSDQYVAAIRLINSAQFNFVKYCNIRACAATLDNILISNSAVVFFSTASAGSGNSNNTIDYCDITTASSSLRPYRMVHSLGSAGFGNNTNTVSNCNIYDCFKSLSTSNGIFISSNSSDWTITGNNLYETTPVVPASNSLIYYFIRVDNTLGNNFTISDNFIGGTAPDHTGIWTVNAAFTHSCRAIYLNVGMTTASSVQNNTIQGMAYTSSSTTPWYGIYISAGNVNVGTTTGNVIGSVASPITVTSAAAVATTMGIINGSTGTVSIQNNTIRNITTVGSATNANNFYGIYGSGSSGPMNISNNLIGSNTSAGSITASSTSTTSIQSVIGINCLGAGTKTINGNTVANLTNASTATSGQIIGIYASIGANTVTNNNVHHLTIANANTSSNNLMSVAGIYLAGSGAAQTVSGNTVHDLSNSYSAFAGHIAGLYLALPITAANTIAQNFIYNLSVNALSIGATTYGIKIVSGNSTYANNIISLGGNTATTLYGIYVNDLGVDGHSTNLYFNTVYLSGITIGFQPSYALYSVFGAVSTSTRDFRNNIFYNARIIGSTKAPGNGSGTHFAAYFEAISGPLTCDYNDYYVSTALNGGGMLGHFGADKAILPIVTGFDRE